MNNKYNTIVLGLGAVGSAAIYQLAKRDGDVLGIDKFSPPHKIGSTHGDTRITRQAIGEGEECVPLALRSYEIWDAIEKETGKKLLTITGGLIIGNDTDNLAHGNNNFLQATIDTAKKFNILHSVLSNKELRNKFSQFNIEPTYKGYYENKAGFLRPEVCVETQIELAKKLGAQIHMNEVVRQFIPLKDGSVEVRTDKEVYTTKKLIVSAGPWVSQLVPEYAALFKVYRQVLYWFDIKGPITPYLPENFPIFIFVGNGEYDIYGFPAIDGPHGGLKIAFEDYATSTTPEETDRRVSKEEIEKTYKKYVKKYLPGLSDRCVRTATCLYTVTPDFKFVIDTLPKHPQIIIASPCSGHGFKHSAAIGEVLAQLAIDGKSKIDISKFNLKRLLS